MCVLKRERDTGCVLPLLRLQALNLTECVLAEVFHYCCKTFNTLILVCVV